MTFFPVSVEPVNITKSTASISGFPTTEPCPVATWKTFSGIPHSRRHSAMSSEVSGVFSAGLRIAALPAASAGMQSPNELVSG